MQGVGLEQTLALAEKLALAETIERNAIHEIRQRLSPPRGITGIGKSRQNT